MPNQKSDLVEEFILSTLPRDYLESLRMLASLKFPLADKKSFTKNLERESKSKESGKTAAALLIESFSGLDFPIESPQSALEKFHTKHLWAWDPVSFQKLGDDLPEKERLRKLRVSYINDFGLECGLEAYDGIEQRVDDVERRLTRTMPTLDPVRRRLFAFLMTDLERRNDAMFCLRTRGDRLPPWWPTELRPGGA